MSVRLNPCHGCPIREGCLLVSEWKAKVSRLGLSSASFNCPRLGNTIRPGRRIVITAPVNGVERDYGKTSRREVTATITAIWKRHRFSATVDAGQIGEDDIMENETSAGAINAVNAVRFRKPMAHRRIVRFLNEPDRNICEAAHHVIGPDGRCDTPPMFQGGEIGSERVCPKVIPRDWDQDPAEVPQWA